MIIGLEDCANRWDIIDTDERWKFAPGVWMYHIVVPVSVHGGIFLVQRLSYVP